MDTAERALLILITRGHATIAELLRMADFIPEPFLQLSTEDQRRYSQILADFSYNQSAEQHDSIIPSDSVSRLQCALMQ